MAKKFQELESRMSPDARRRSRALAREMLSEMLLSEIRNTVGLTQEELAATLDVRQPTISRLESQDDMQVSTLRRVVAALGGTLELIVHLPQGDIRLTQFDAPAKA